MEGANAETRCKAGFYNPKKGQTSEDACKPCDAGHACPIGSKEMTKCQPGSFNNQTEQASCTKCAAGTFQKDKGKTGCEPCKKGNYCTKGASSGTPCEAGRFGNRTGLTSLHECHFCEPGHSCLIGATVRARARARARARVRVGVRVRVRVRVIRVST